MRTLPSLLLALLCLALRPDASAQVNAALGKPVTTQYSTSSSSATYASSPSYNAAKITDGNFGTFSHPDTMATTLGFRYDINLGRSWALDRLRIYNRSDCCPERLSNYRVSILADNGAGVPVLPALWTAVIRPPGSGNSGAGGFDEVLPTANPSGTFTGQWIRIENISGAAYTTQIAEVQALVFDTGGSPNIALYKPVVFRDNNNVDAAVWPGFPATNLTDGAVSSFSHPFTFASTLNYYYQVDLQSDVLLGRLQIYGRGDGCCQERLSNYRVSLLADNAGLPGVQTWSAEMHTDGTWPPTGGADTIIAAMGAGSFHGRFLRVTNIGDMTYNPQIGEIEAYRPPVPVINFFTTTAGNITATGAPGLPANATLSWKVTGATSLSINQGIGTVTLPAGTTVVTPATAKTYTLTATNSSGSSTAAVTIAVDAVQTAPRINEFMADNAGALADEDGSHPDWIELYNPNTFTLGLTGAHLSDDPLLSAKWAFPSGASIPPNGYLVVFASNKNRTAPGAPLHTNFVLKKSGETITLTSPTGSLWSRIPADYPATPMYPPQYRDTSYGVNGTGGLRFFRPSTPGAVNAAAGFTAVVEDTSFSVKRGIYSTPQSVAITCLTPGAVIRYTTDGSLPTESTGTVYAGPVSVATTTVIRAAAYLAGAAPSNADTHTYLFPASVASQPNMLAIVTGNATWGPQIPDALRDVPSISLTTPNLAAINGDTEVETSFEWIHPTDPLQNAHAGSGLTYYGGGFTAFAKQSLRLYFRGQYGDKTLKAPLFTGNEHGLHAVQEFDGLELRSGSHDMNQRGFYMSNLYTDQVLMEMGHLAPHGRFVHLYLNGAYWGLYHMRERWNAAMSASYLGGKKEDYEAINGNYNVGGWATPGQPFDGDGAAWEYAKSHSTNYPEIRGLIDVPDFTDYMITFMFGNSEDEWRGVSPNRLTGPGSGSRFMLNDADGWLSVDGNNAVGVWDGNDNNTASASSWNGTTFTAGRSPGDGPGALFAAMYLTAGADFRTLLADRIHSALFNNGPLTPSQNQARLDAMCSPIQRAFIAESARWNYRLPADPPGGAESAGDWEDAWTVCRNSWMPTRTAIVLDQFRTAGLYPALDAPVFSPNGGVFTVAPPQTLTMTAPAGATIYYSLDGSDPRAPGGVIAGTALRYLSPVILTQNAVVRSRSRDASANWSALQENFFQSAASSPCPAGSVVPAELHFNPTGDADAEFIELLNVSSAAVNLRGCRFTAGVDFAFSEYRDTLLAPGQRLVLVDSEFAHRARYGWDRTIGGIYYGNLSNGGEQLVLTCGATTVFDFTFDGAWSPLADNGGYSLTLIHPQPGQNLSDPANWRASTTADGTPGTSDSGPAFTGNPNADTDYDGSSALLEYATGTSDANAAERPLVSLDPGNPTSFHYTRAAAADDAILIPEISTDLTTWLSDPLNLKVLTETVLPGGKVNTVLQPQPGVVTGATHYFVRLRAVLR